MTERTGGVPLFVEEVTRLLLERGEQGGIQAIPPTLQQSLMARLDRLGPAREVAQIGSVIGRDFSYRAASRRGRNGGRAACKPRWNGSPRPTSCWCRACRRIPIIVSSTRSFRTRLMRICSRAGARSCTAALPRRCAISSPAAAAAEPELLAHHFTQAGLTEAAIEWWGKAGQRSLERSALVEAIAQFTRALDQIAALPATPALRREADQASGRAHNPTHPYQRICGAGNQGGCGAGTNADRAGGSVGEPPEDPLLLFSVLYGFWVANYMAFNGDVLRDLAAQFLALAEKQGATVPLMIGHRVMGYVFAVYGRNRGRPGALRSSDCALRSCQHRPLATRFGQDNRVAILCLSLVGSMASWLSRGRDRGR